MEPSKQKGEESSNEVKSKNNAVLRSESKICKAIATERKTAAI